jgi:hypothetical protein
MGISTGCRRILFLGNSHTYRHNVPRLLAGLVAAADGRQKVDTEIHADRGVSLEWHWHNARSRELIAMGTWDYVVLQEKSAGPVEAPDRMFQYARLLSRDIVTYLGKVVLYMTWANRESPEQQKLITDAYVELAGELGAKLIPVGRARENALACDPGLNLYDDDGRHSSLVGAYLGACVFFAAICGASPEGLPGTLWEDESSLCDLPMPLALRLQRIAYRTFLDEFN